jgi:hypothetical protein
MSTSTPHSLTSGARSPQSVPCLPDGLAKQFDPFRCKPGGLLIDDEWVDGRRADPASDHSGRTGYYQ